MKIAIEKANNLSKDPHRKVGAIILERDTFIELSAGYNGLPRGFKETKRRWCKSNKHKYVVHAELNAIIHASRSHANIKDSIIVSTRFPCHQCTLAIVQAGIKTVVTIEPDWDSLSDKWKESFNISKEVLDECGVEIVYVSLDSIS